MMNVHNATSIKIKKSVAAGVVLSGLLLYAFSGLALAGQELRSFIAVPGLANTTYHYTAKTQERVKVSGNVLAGGLTWKCNDRQCTISGPWPTPGVSACNALAKRVGRIISYGHPGKQLTGTQINQCNAGVAAPRAMNVQRLSQLANPAAPKINPALTKINTALLVKLRPLPPGEQKEGESGPDHQKEVDLITPLAGTIPEIESDFTDSIGWYHIVYQDKSDPTVYYYLPSELRITRDPNPSIGYRLKFTYGYSSTERDEDLISMDIVLAAPYRERDYKLLEELAKRAIGVRNLSLRPVPMHSVKVDIEQLQEAFEIDPENISITSPRNVRDQIVLSIKLKDEKTKEMLVAKMRDIGLSGVLKINVGTAEIETPLRINFSEYSGPVVSEFDDVARGKPLMNLSPFPITMKGVVAYTRSGRGAIKREELNFRTQMKIPPGGKRTIRDIGKAFRGKTIVHAWFDYDIDSSCSTCLAAIEKKVLATPGLTSKETLAIEAMEVIFSEDDVFTIMLEVKSRYFEAAGVDETVRHFVLKKDAAQYSPVLYLDREKSTNESKFSYRYLAIMSDGSGTDVSPWMESEFMYITIGPSQVERLKGE